MIKVCPRCHQAFDARYDFYRYCEECFVPCEMQEIVNFKEDKKYMTRFFEKQLMQTFYLVGTMRFISLWSGVVT